MTYNGLRMSPEKTNLILISTGDQPKILPKFTLYNTAVEYKKYTKFLGLTLNTKLSWYSHIENAIQKAKKNLNVIKRSFKTTMGNGSFNINPCFNSHNPFRIILWSRYILFCPQNSTKKITKHRLQSIQNGLRCPYTHTF